MESTAAHLQQLETELEETYSTLLDTDAINTVVDGITSAVSVLNDFLSSLGGGMSTLSALGVMAVNVFNNQIGAAIEKQITNAQILKQNEEAVASVRAVAELGMAETDSKQTNEAYQQQAKNQQRILDLSSQIGTEEYNRLTTLNQEATALSILLAKYDDMSGANVSDEDKWFGISEDANVQLKEATQEVKDQISLHKELKKEKESILEYDSKTSVTRQDTVNHMKEEASLSQFLGEIDSNNLLTQEQKNNLVQAEQNYLNGTISLEEYLQTILSTQSTAMDNANTKREQAKQLVKEIAEWEGADMETLRAHVATLNQLLQEGGSDGKGGRLLGLNDHEQQQAISQTVQGVTALTTGVTSLVNAVRILDDDSLSGWEKFSQISSNLLITLPMLIRSFDSIKSLLPNIATLMGASATATASWGSSLAFVGTTLGGFLPEIIAVGAAIGVVVAVAKAFIDEANKYSNATEEAAESAERLADANEALTETYEDLQSTIEAYDSAKEQLDECIEGTEEWQDALEEANSAAIELLNTVSELSAIDLSSLVAEYGELYDSSTGTFNQDIIDAIEEQYSQLVSASDLSSGIGAYNESIASARENFINFTETPGVSGLTTEDEILEWITNNLDNLSGLTNEKLTKAFENQFGDFYVEDIDAFRESINEFATSVSNATITLDALADVNVSEILSNEDYSDAVEQAVSNMLLADTENGIESQVKNLNDRFDIFDTGNSEEYTKLVEQLRDLGLDVYATDGQKAVSGTDNDRTFYFNDADGNLIEDGYSTKTIAAMLAAADAEGRIAENAETMATALDTLEKNTSEDIAAGFEDYLTSGNFESLTQSDFDALLAAFGVENIEGLTADMITEYLGKTMKLSEEQLAAMFGSEDYATDMVDAANDYATALQSYLDGMFNSTQEAFAELETTSDLSASSGKYIADALQGAIIYGTKDTLDTLQDTFNSIDSDELDDFAKAIEDVDDWSSLSADDLLDILDSADVSTELTTEELEAFIQAMSETSEATAATTESLQETYASLHEIIDGLETGDTLSSDDYKTLIDEVGDQASSYFTMMLDGTYKLTGDAEDFYDMVQSQQIENFTNQIEDYKSQMNQLQSISEEDLKVYADATELRVNETREEALSTMEALGTSKEQIAEWRDEIESLKQDIEDTTKTSKKATLNGELQAIYQEIADTASSYNIDDIDAAWENAAETIRGLGLAIAESAEDYEQLKQYLDEGTISAESFSLAYQEMWDAERTEDLDSDELEDYANYLQEIADESNELSNDLIGNDEAAEDLAAQIMNMNDAVEDLSDNWEDWSDILKNSSKESEEYADTITSVKDAMSKLLDIDNEFISNDLILNNMEDIEAAAKGDADAIDRLRAAALEDIIVNLDLDDSALSNEQLALEVSNLQAQLDAMGDLQVGAEIDDADFIAACNEMIDSANLTVDQVNALFSAMGYEVNVKTEEQPVEQRNPYTITETEVTGWNSGTATGPDGEAREWSYPILKTHTYNDGYATETGYVDAIAMTSDGTSPVINSITKKATGSSNNSSSRNAGGNSTGDTGSSGSGGGSSSEPDTEDYLEDEIDRYHDINLELQKIATTLSRLQNVESKLTGQDLLDNLNEQISTLNDQIDATTRKMQIAEAEAEEYRTALADQGVTFDEDGYITNYAAIVQEKLNYVNECIAKYNTMSATEQEAYKDTLEDIKEDYQDFVDMISDYDTLISETIPGLEDDIRDALDQQIELEITKFTMEVEIRLDMTEAEQDWNEFYRKVILGLDDDDILGNAAQDLADILSYFNTTASDITDMSAENLSDWIEQMSEAIANGGTGSIQSLTDQLNDTLDQLAQYDDSGWMDVYGDDQAQALEDLQTYYTELMSQLEDVEDLMDDIEESYLDMIDEAIDAFDEQVDQYEYINDLLNHDVELISLLYGDDAYEQMAEYYAQIEANNNQELDFLRQRVDYAYQMMQAETDDEARKKWQEEWEDALEELNDKVEDSVENLIDQYSNTINQIIDELNDAVTNGLGLDYVEEEWDLINDKADIYLDEINSMYEIQALQQKYLDAINDTDSIAAQQKLNDLMEEQVAYLQDKENLTEYDVERAEKLYEIALAEIALEEAQQNKSTMRLRRDSQGNYRYEYVSDDDAVAEAQQELLTLQNELYNFDKEAYQQNLNDLYSYYNEYQEKLLDLYYDQTLSAEEKEEKMALYAEYYGDIVNALVDENAVLRENLMDSAFTELAALYDTDVDNFRNMSEEEQDELMNSLVPQWDSSVQDMADTFAGEGGFIPTCQDAFDALDEATEDYEESLNDLEAAAGVDLDSIATGYDEVTAQVQELIYTNEDLISQYADEISAIQNVMSELSSLIAQYQSAQAAAEAATAAAYAYWQAVQKANAAAIDYGSTSSSGTTTTVTTSSTTYPGTSSSSSSSGSGSSGSGSSGSSGSSSSSSGSSSSSSSSSSGGAGGGVKATQTYYMYAYDTGGYTGDWETSDGKLAILHEKELVLNDTDTENILNTVGMVRDISGLLSNLNSSAFDKIISYMSGLNGSIAQTESASDTLEQNVHIDATFTDATTAKEIEDAFNSLINVASQYAYRNTR